MSYTPNVPKWGGGGQAYSPLPDAGGPPAPEMYAPVYAAPSYPPNNQFAPPSGPPPMGPNGYPTDNKSPFENGRFMPKKRINDPIFLILYLLFVSTLFGFGQGN